MIKESIKLRAHHGMCLAFFEGKGYSENFTEHMQKILYAMQDNPKLQIVAESDVICSKCPNLKNGKCTDCDLVQEYDRQVLSLCGLKEPSKIKWNEFSKLVAKKIIVPGKREEICGSCQWTAICTQKETDYKF